MSMKIEGNSPVSGYTLSTQADLAADLGGDVNAQVAAMMLVHAREKGSDLREMRQAQTQNIRTRQKEQIEHMRERAEATRAAGKASAMGKFTEGVFTMTAGAVAMDLRKDENSMKIASDLFKGLGTSGSAAIDYFGTTRFQTEADNADIAATSKEHQIKEMETQLQDIREEQKEAANLVKGAIDFLKEINAAKDKIDQSLVYRRA